MFVSFNYLFYFILFYYFNIFKFSVCNISLTMREIVHLQVGRCGNQIGSKVSID